MIAAADHLADHYHEAPAILVFCFQPGIMAITDVQLEEASIKKFKREVIVLTEDDPEYIMMQEAGERI